MSDDSHSSDSYFSESSYSSSNDERSDGEECTIEANKAENADKSDETRAKGANRRAQRRTHQPKVGFIDDKASTYSSSDDEEGASTYLSQVHILLDPATTAKHKSEQVDKPDEATDRKSTYAHLHLGQVIGLSFAGTSVHARCVWCTGCVRHLMSECLTLHP